MNKNRPNEGYYDFMPSAIAVLENPPARHYRLVSWIIIIFMIIALLWLTLAKVDIVVSARGKLVPAGKVKVIQSANDGSVQSIFVRDGMKVSSGQALIELNGTSSQADLERLKFNQTKAQLTVQRIKSELGISNDKLGQGIEKSGLSLAAHNDLLDANMLTFQQKIRQIKHEQKEAKAAHQSSVIELEKQNEKVTFLDNQYQKSKHQSELGIIARKEAEKAEFDLIASKKDLSRLSSKEAESKAKLNSVNERLKTAKSEHNSDLYMKLTEAEFELNSINKELIKAKEQVELQVLRSPVDGVVQQLEVNTVGGYVTRAQKLMVIVPDTIDLELNAQIHNKDIGFVDQDQKARVKVDAFEFTRYGYLKGDLQWVGNDAVVDDKLGEVYPARIALSESVLPNKVNGRVAKVLPGMTASVDIVIGERRLIEYFIAPILRYKDESLRER